jgi:hypothetical protein
MERETQTPLKWGTGIVLLEMNHRRTLLDHMAWEERITEAECLLISVKEID